MWKKVWDNILDILKTEAIKKVVVMLLKTSSGFKAWVLSIILGLGWDHLIEPIIKWGRRKALLGVDKATGEIVLYKLKGAKEDGDKESYRRTIGRV